MEEALIKMIEMIQNLSPAVWGIIMKQVYSEIIFKFIWSFTFGLSCYVSHKIVKKEINENNYDAPLWLIPISLASLSFLYLVNALKWMANPEFYAIRWLLQTVTGG